MNRKIFALMDNNIVQSFLIAYDSEYAVSNAKNLYINGDAVDCTYIDCKIGDEFKNGSFYRGDLEIYPEYCTPDYKRQIEKCLDNAKKKINFLEKILNERGLDKLIE